jgi:hypothetical protein
MKLLLTTTATALLAGVALAADKNAITYPDSSLSLHLGDTVVVSYTTDYETPWMYIFCENGDALNEIIYYAPVDIADHTSITFDLTYDYMPTGKCFFNLRSSQHVADDNTIVGVVSPFDYDQTEGDHETFSSGESPSPPSSNTTAGTTTTAPAATTTNDATSAVPTTKAASNSTMTTSKALVTASSSSTTPEETTGGSEATSSPTSTVTLPPSGGSRTGVALGAVLIAALAVFG